MMGVLGAIALGFLGVVALIALWAARVMGRAEKADERQQLITLAARAASDEGGRGLLALLKALEGAPPGQAVTVGWLARKTATDDGKGFLVKIAWDGNEWRRATAPGPLRAALEARLAEEPALDGPDARRLLADLAAADAPGG